jgi:4-amino-4-deoxy-L-arabinose transferase-like glycosyltransferase
MICAFFFLLAFTVRLLTWHDTRFEVGKVQSSVAADYQRIAQLFRQERLRGFFSSSSALADPNHLGHPPGYSILIAVTQSVFGESNSKIQFVQIVADSLAAVIIFLIVAELFYLTPAVIAGLFASFSPQLAWNSVLLLPDSLAVLPILLSIYLLARTRHKPRLITFLIAGALIGISCWLRANAMLLMFFVAASALLLHGKKHWRYSLAVICGTLILILPLTLRNAIVFHRFIPVSLGAGQTLLEGIADYDPSGRFGIPNTDMGIMRQEAEIFQRPDYYGTLFNPDGVEREHARLGRGAGVIASHPLWFTGVMIRRAASMTRLERARLISTSPAVSHPFDPATQPIVLASPGADLLSRCRPQTPAARLSSGTAGFAATLAGNDSTYGKQFSCGPLPVSKDTEYAFEIPVRIDRGRMRVSITAGGEQTYVSDIIEPVETKNFEQPVKSLYLPFVSNASSAEIVFSNEASGTAPIVQVGEVKLHELGPARFLWTRYPRIFLRLSQRLFITAAFLPLALIGLGVMLFRKQRNELVILLAVPLYYFTVQSAFHTEYRYVLAVNYFVFGLAGVAASWAGGVTLRAFPNYFRKTRSLS